MNSNYGDSKLKYSIFSFLKLRSSTIRVIVVLSLYFGTSSYSHALKDWNEGDGTIGCAWAKDVPGEKFVVGVGAPTVTLDFYSDFLGKTLIKSVNNDHNFYLAVAKKGQFIKLRLNDDFVGWVSEKKLQVGALRNCN